MVKFCSPAPVAQWTERQPPELKSTVRVRAGVQKGHHMVAFLIQSMEKFRLVFRQRMLHCGHEIINVKGFYKNFGHARILTNDKLRIHN
jgi:hypothetical protein